jgi:hypothetical protein
VPRDGTGPDSNGKSDGGDSGRRRSLIALLIVAGLIGLSLYVGHVLRQSSRIEDCEMQGRTNCAPITTDNN